MLNKSIFTLKLIPPKIKVDFLNQEKIGLLLIENQLFAPDGKRKKSDLQNLVYQLKKYLEVVNGIWQVLFQFFQNLEIGAAVIMTLPFLKILQEIKLLLVV